MPDIEEQIKNIEKEIRDTPYHKATEHYIGKLRAKLSKLKDKDIDSQTKGKGGGKRYAIKHHGDATVVLVGPPSVGKSTLLNKLTNAKSKVAPYLFTTVTVIPGMMDYKDAKIQILDVPGLIEGAEEGKGRGREVLSVIRGADLIIMMTDTKRIAALKRISNTLERNGIRINIVRPNVVLEKKLKGGITIHTNINQGYSKETVKNIANEMGIKNAEIILKEKISIDSLIDALSSSRVYIPAFYLVNKIDQHKKTIKSNVDYLTISAEKEINLDNLKEKIWENLAILRIYLVREGEEPSTDNPLIIKKGSKLKDVAEKIGEEFASDKKRAIIWGSRAKYPGQEVSLTTTVEENMQVRFI